MYSYFIQNKDLLCVGQQPPQSPLHHVPLFRGGDDIMVIVYTELTVVLSPALCVVVSASEAFLLASGAERAGSSGTSVRRPGPGP